MPPCNTDFHYCMGGKLPDTCNQCGGSNDAMNGKGYHCGTCKNTSIVWKPCQVCNADGKGPHPVDDSNFRGGGGSDGAAAYTHAS